MKRIFAGILMLGVLTGQMLQAQIDRNVVPGPGPAPAVAFPDYELITTANGMRVIILTDSKLPTVSMRLLIDRKPAREGDLRGVIELAGGLLCNGTTTRTKDQIDEQVDMLGAHLSSGGTSVFASGLSKYTEQLMELMADITLHPSFPQDELEKVKTQTISGLKFRKTEPNAVADAVRRVALYGTTHPYGEIETEETVGRITREKCLETYNTFFKPNYAILAIVGDIHKDAIMKLVEKDFGSWAKGTIPEPTYELPKPIEKITVDMVDRPAAVQTVTLVGQTVQLPWLSPDVIPVSVMNTVLGGGAFRLFVNLREKHAYTYGAYSSVGPDALIGAFTASASVKTAVTDSALTQIFYEIGRVRDEKVDAKELQMAKNYMTGSFARSLETPDRVASYAIDMERYNLPKDYYKTYLKKVDAVTAEDVQRVARKYLAPDKMLVTVVGSAKDLKDKLGAFGPVVMYDEEGNKVVAKALPAVTLTPDEVFAKFVEKTGGKKKMAALKDRTMEFSGSMQNMTLSVKTTQKAPGMMYQETGMMGMVQKVVFDGQKGWATGPRGVSDLSGEQLEGTKVDAAMNFYDLYKTLGYTAGVTGTKTIQGVDCFEVSFTKEGAPAVKHYFGVLDFLKRREVTTMSTPQGPMEQSTELLDYKDFKGYLVPSRLQQSVMGQTIEFKLEKFDVNTGVKDALFQKPAK